MVDGNTILSAIEADLNKYQNQFNQVEVELQEAEDKVKELKNKREQIRGAFSSLYKYYTAYSENANTQQDESDVVEKVAEISSGVENCEVIQETSSENNKECDSEKCECEKSCECSENKSNKLTAEEQAKIKAQLNKAKRNEVPDYLQSEYKK